MIGKLTGIVDLIQDDFLIIDVNGVGYKVFCSSKTLDRLEYANSKISLYIETVVREDSITLFGFKNLKEQTCFNTLCKVSGVGSKVAQKIMGIADVDEIVLAIVNEDKDIFCRAPGVGSKVALRIITELQNCSMVKGFDSIKLTSDKINVDDINNKQIITDSIIALEGLGYQKSLVKNIVLNIFKEKPHLTLESVITESLKKINNF